MRTRSQTRNRNRRQQQQTLPVVVEPCNLQEPIPGPTIVAMADQTMEELLRAPTEGYGEAIVLPEINAGHFEIKTNLLQLVQANPFHGLENENPHAHINSFKRITSTLRVRNVPNDVIKLMIFSYSLEGAAKTWYEKEPPNSILTWDDLVTNEAWERFKGMLRSCPHHGFSELTQVDTFYNGLTENEQDSLNAAAGGNLLSNTREALNIIENKSKVRYSRNKTNASKVNSRENVSKTDERIDKLADQLSTLVEIVSKKVVAPPAPVKAVEENCVTYGGSHAWYKCLATDNNQNVCATTGTYNQQAPPNRVSNQMAPPGFAPVQNQDLRFDISFMDALFLMPRFAPTIRDLLMNKEKLLELVKIPLNENCSALLLKKLPEKLGDPGKFLIPCEFPGMEICYALTDLGASINLMPLLIWKKLSLLELSPTRMSLELADRSITYPKGLAEDVYVKVGKIHFPTNFVVVDFEADPRVPLILGKSFLKTGRTLIDVYEGEITLHVDNEAVTFNLDQTMKYYSTNDKSVNRIDIIDEICEEYVPELLGFPSNYFSSGNPTSTSEPFTFEFTLEEIDAYLYKKSISLESDHDDCDPEEDIYVLEQLLNDDPFQLSLMDLKQSKVTEAKSSIKDPPDLELKDLPSHLEYAFLEENDKLPFIIAKYDCKPSVQSQRRVNPKIHEVIKNEVIKLFDAGMIYPIFDSPWVSPIHCVPKKGGMTVVANEENELIPTRLVTGWRVCIDYRKLNKATRKDHFPLPIMDQMLERLAGNEFYNFLDGFSGGIFQIPIDPKIKEKNDFYVARTVFCYIVSYALWIYVMLWNLSTL
ncbi:reverse transcriptase domain-containing protein [Tanacetum coccineum]|uniref:Reverse transcriptase domain-containing protein n=1 Tax=Tanacetum coccineum TaxID=301880 RepID=A0ABQ5F658_9ASTR